MDRILFIGDYYPLFSYKSRQNFNIVEELHKKGHDIILLSKAWCTVNENNFYGTVQKLSCDYPFYKRYFLDPVQIRNYNIDIFNAFLGLGCKVIEREHITQIIFADDIIYSPIVELLKKRYNIPCYLFLFWAESFKCMMDDYVWPYMNANLEAYDQIFTYLPYKETLVKYMNINGNKIRTVCTVSNTLPENYCYKLPNNIYLYSEDLNAEHLKRILTDISKKLNYSGAKIYIISASIEDSDTFIFEDNHYKKLEFKDIPKGAAVLYDYELLVSNPVNFGFIFTCLSCGFYPIINENHLSGLKELNMSYCKLGNYYVVNDYKKEDVMVGDYI